MKFSLATCKPTKWQKIIIDDETRFKVVAAHRSAGKSQLACIEVLIRLMTCKADNPLAVIIAPEKGQAGDIFIPKFRTILKGVAGVKITHTQNESSITFPDGRRIMFAGVKDKQSVDALRGMDIDYLVWDEMGFISEYAFKALMPTLTRYNRPLGRSLFLGTPNGANLFYDVFQLGNNPKVKDYKSFKFTVYETGMFSEDTIETFKASMTQGAFEQEYLAEFFANDSGYYYASALKELRGKGHIKRIPYNVNELVHTSWDIGISNDFIVLFQVYDNKVWVIDYKTEAKPKGLESTANMLKSLPYKYGYHYLPHDIAHRSNSSGIVRLGLLKDLLSGHGTVKPTKKYAVQEGIAATLKILPFCLFDSLNCVEIVNSLENYAQNTINGILVSEPKHDKFSHGADAFRYLALNTKLDSTLTNLQVNTDDYFNPFDNTRQRKYDTAISEYNPFDYDGGNES